MKIKNKFKITSLSLAISAITPIIAIPLINATSVKHTYVGDDVLTPTNVPDKDVHFGDYSYFTTHFQTSSKHPDWGTFASITYFHVDKRDSFPIFQIPATVEQNGVEYKVRMINSSKEFRGEGTIDVLDFSKAEWLDSIEDSSFYYKVENAAAKIRSVNFSGARRLTRICENAFAHQHFDNTVGTNNNVFDFSGCTSLELIGRTAFEQCCADNKNIFNAIIFPPSLKNIHESAFKGDTKKCKINFKKIIFTNPDPKADLFDGDQCLPQLYDPLETNISVPYGSKDKYVNILRPLDKQYASCFYQSSIKFDTTNVGSKNVSVLSNIEGMDDKQWEAVDDKGVVHANLFPSSVNKNLYVDQKGHLNWKPGVTPGEYDNVRMYAYKYDDKEGEKLSIAVSPDPIHISSFKAELTGGSTYLAPAIVDGGGEDPAHWSVKIDTPDAKPITEVRYSIANIEESLEGKVGVLTLEDKTCFFGWGVKHLLNDFTADDVGQHCVIIKCEFKNGCENTLTIFKKIFLNIGLYGKITTVAQKLDKNGSEVGDPIPLPAAQIPIDADQSIRFTMTLPEGTQKDYPPNVALDYQVTMERKDNRVYSFEFNDKEHKRDNGVYQFYAMRVADAGEESYTAYSDVIDVKIKGTVDLAIETMPSELSINKATAGSQSIKIIDDQSNAIITDVVALPAPWKEWDKRLAEKKIEFEIDPDDNQSVFASWTSHYSTDAQEAIDINDIMLKIYIEDLVSHKHYYVFKALTVVAGNESQVDYTGEEAKIIVNPNKITASPYPFKFYINNPIPVSSSIRWGVKSDNDILKDALSMISANESGSSAYLQCDLTKAEIAEGLYDAYVYAVDENNITASYTAIKIDTRVYTWITGLPEKLIITAGSSGTSPAKLHTIIGGNIAQNPTYTIIGELSPHMSVKDDSITWDNEIKPGLYSIEIVSKAKLGTKDYEAHSTIAVEVTEPTKKDNTAAIIGGSVGGAVAVGGAATGTTLGIRRHKLLKGKKK